MCRLKYWHKFSQQFKTFIGVKKATEQKEIIIDSTEVNNIIN